MTPTEAGANASAPTSLNDSIDAAFASTPAAESVDTSSAESTVDDIDEAVDLPAPDPEPVAEEAAAPAAEPEIEEIPDEEIGLPDKMSKDGKLHYYTKAKADKLIKAYQDMRSIQDTLGPDTTLDSLKAMQSTAVGAEVLLTDFELATPESIDRALGFIGNDNPHALGMMAVRLATHLPQVNPKADAALRNHYGSAVVSDLYAKAQKSGSESDWLLAQNLDFSLRGKFVNKEEVGSRDLMAEREQQLVQREQQFNQRTQQEQNQRRQAWMQQTHNTLHDTVQTEIDAAIPPAVLKAFEGKPQLKHIKRDLLEVVEQAESANTDWKRRYSVALERANARPGEEARAELVAMKRQLAQQVIAKNRKAIIEAATGTILSANAAAHQKQQQAAGRREPPGTGSPHKPNVPLEKMKEAKSLDQMFQAIGW